MNCKTGSSGLIISLGAGIASVTAAVPAFAVNGAQLSSFGVKAAGMGGTSIALPQDSIEAANNPAGLGVVGDRYDIGSQLIEPTIDYQFGSADNSLHAKKFSPVPEGGFNRQLNPDATFGVSIFGVGVAANFGRAALPVPGAEKAKSALAGLVAAPTLTYKLNGENFIGFSLDLAYERLLVQGVIQPNGEGGFTPVQSHGTSSATGYGVRFGYLWKPAPTLALGALYASTIHMSQLSGYKDDLLVPSNGRLNVPGQYGLGASWQATPSLVVATDWLRIDWNRTAYGSKDVFSWKNQNIFRAGAAYDVSTVLTLRTGFTHGNHQFDSDAVGQNFLTAISNSKALTFGAGYRLNETDEINISYEHGLSVQQQGTGQSQGFEVKSRTMTLGLSYGHRF